MVVADSLTRRRDDRPVARHDAPTGMWWGRVVPAAGKFMCADAADKAANDEEPPQQR